MPAELVRVEQAKRKGRPFALGTPRGDGGMDAADGIDCSSVIFPQFGQQRASPIRAAVFVSMP